VLESDYPRLEVDRGRRRINRLATGETAGRTISGRNPGRAPVIHQPNIAGKSAALFFSHAGLAEAHERQSYRDH